MYSLHKSYIGNLIYLCRICIAVISVLIQSKSSCFHLLHSLCTPLTSVLTCFLKRRLVLWNAIRSTRSKFHLFYLPSDSLPCTASSSITATGQNKKERRCQSGHTHSVEQPSYFLFFPASHANSKISFCLGFKWGLYLQHIPEILRPSQVHC